MWREFSKKWIFVFLLAAFSFFIALRTSIGFFSWFFWFLTSFIIINLAWVTAQYFLAQLHLERTHIYMADAGDWIKIQAVVENRGFLPVFNFILEDNLGPLNPQEKKKRILREYLPAKSVFKAEYKSLCPKRGKFNIGAFNIYFVDPFNIFFFKKTYHVYSEIYVFPKTFKIQKFPPMLKGLLPWFGIQTSHISAEEDEFYGIREYREGDPIKRIHWFSTARNNKLIVKQFQRQTYSRATLIFNLEKNRDYGEGQERISEYVARIAASISRNLVENGTSLEVFANVGEIFHVSANKGQEHLTDILRFLAIARPEGMASLGETFEEFSAHIPNNSTLIVIMLDKDWEYLPLMLPLKERNISLIPIILISSTFLSKYEKQEVVRDVKIKISQSFNFHPIVFSRGDNLEEAFFKD